MALPTADCVLYDVTFTLGGMIAPPLQGIAPETRGSLMKLSARNKLKGKILDVKKGATTAHVRLEIAPGQIVTASITNEAVEELGLKPGGAAIAVIKASDVMIAVD
jgi:molybdopterin-binding protein